jgi:hypothetical protein
MYIRRDTISRVSGIEFDWDDRNTKHLAAHNVTPAEFEQAMNNNPPGPGL